MAKLYSPYNYWAVYSNGYGTYIVGETVKDCVNIMKELQSEYGDCVKFHKIKDEDWRVYDGL